MTSADILHHGTHEERVVIAYILVSYVAVKTLLCAFAAFQNHYSIYKRLHDSHSKEIIRAGESIDFMIFLDMSMILVTSMIFRFVDIGFTTEFKKIVYDLGASYLWFFPIVYFGHIFLILTRRIRLKRP